MPVIILVQEAIQNTLSSVMGAGVSTLILPEACEISSSPARFTATKTQPGICVVGSEVAASIAGVCVS